MEEHKKKIEQMVIDTSLTAFEKKEIPEEELSRIADFVLKKIDLAQNHQQLTVFLKELVSKWPIFKNILTIELGEETKMREMQTGKQVLTLIQNGNTLEAINLARKGS